MYDFDLPKYNKGASKAQKQKGFKYLAHRPGDEGHDPAREIGVSNWVFSYADMMTSMLVFLVMILSFSQINYDKLQEISSAHEVKKKPDKVSETRQTPLQQVESQFEELELFEGVSFKKELSGGSVTIKDSILFESGHAVISDASKEVLKPIFKILKDLPKGYHFIIEGHTDDNPINTFEYASNWELSAARALSVLFLMKDLGFEETRLSFHAFGEKQPLFPNRDDDGIPIVENQAKNRRAVIKIRQKIDVLTE